MVPPKVTSTDLDTKIGKYQREMLNHKGTRMVKNLTQITNDELEQFRLYFS